MQYDKTTTMPIEAITDLSADDVLINKMPADAFVPQVTFGVSQYVEREEWPSGYDYGRDAVKYTTAEFCYASVKAIGFCFKCQGAKVSGKFAEPIHCFTDIYNNHGDYMASNISLATEAEMAEKIKQHCGKMNYQDTGLEY